MSQWISIVALLVAIIAIVWAYLAHQTALGAINPANISAAIDSVQPLEAKLAAIANTVVMGIEEVRRDPDTPLTNTQAYNQALNQVRAWLPVDVTATNDQIIASVNAAILLASNVTAQIKAAKAAAIASNAQLLATPYVAPSVPTPGSAT